MSDQVADELHKIRVAFEGLVQRIDSFMQGAAYSFLEILKLRQKP